MSAWRWANVPIPEGHVLALAASVLAQRLWPWRITRHGRPVRVLGWLLTICGAALAGWAVRASGSVDLAAPWQLVTAGPYRRSRNPMYLAWTAASAGLALLGNAAWALALTPVGALLAHLATLDEERDLARRFGAAYDTYRERVPRYL